MTPKQLEDVLVKFRSQLAQAYASLTDAGSALAEAHQMVAAATLILSADLKELVVNPTPAPPPPTGNVLRDSNGDVWALESERVTKNGQPATNPDYTSNVVELILHEDIPYQRNKAGNWYKWSGQPHWTAQPWDPRTPAPNPTPAPTPTPNPAPPAGSTGKLPVMENGEYVARDFTIPQHFLGMHLNTFPEGLPYGSQTPSKTPQIKFYNVNNWDYSERSAGVHMISQPRIMDKFFDYWSKEGAFIIDTPALMPKEVASDQRDLGPYNWPGCTSELNLNKRQQYKDAAKARLTRYKGKIKVLNPMNEPDFGKVDPEADFFRGSMKNAAEIFAVWREVIDEVDPSVLLVGNSAVFWGYQDAQKNEQFGTPFDRFTEALGTTASNNKRVVDMVDAVSIHHYGEYSDSIYAVVTCIERARATLKKLGVEKDIWITECGFINGTAPGVNESASTMRKWVIGAAIAQAKGMYLYSYDGGNFRYMADNKVLQDTYAELQEKLNGKQVKEARIKANGTAKITFKDDSVLEF